MSQIVVQSQAANLVCFITTTAGAPATGLTSATVTCSYRKEGAGIFTAKVLNGGNFTEIGSGVYTVGFTSGELDTAGSFTFIVTGGSINQVVTIATVSAIALGSSTPVAVSTCVVNGYVFDLTGNPIVGASVFARVLALPTILNSIGLSSDSVAAKTDVNGEFFIELVQLAEVEVTIPEIGYKRVFLVPASASVNLFSGIS